MKDSRGISSSMVTLPMDVLFNILIRLPILCLLNMKCVCKSWYSLITSREFSNEHLRRNSFSERLIIYSGVFESLYSINLKMLESPATEIPFPRISERYVRKRIVGSCNGLLLCICDETFSFEGLLLSSSSLPCKIIPKLALPLNCMHINYGLAYDRCIDDYKVVRIVHSLLCGALFCKRTMEVMVYSLRANSWEQAKNNFPVYWTPKSKHGILIDDNLLHWLFPCIFSKLYRIACYDVCSEEWSEIPLFDQISFRPNAAVELGVLDGCLCLLGVGSEETYNGFNVWILREYDESDSWVKLFDFLDWRVIGYLRNPPIASAEDGNEILLKRDESSKVIWYNPTEKSLRESEIRGLSDYHDLSICTRTLVPPCENDQISDGSWPLARRE